MHFFLAKSLVTQHSYAQMKYMVQIEWLPVYSRVNYGVQKTFKVTYVEKLLKRGKEWPLEAAI